MDLVKTNLPNFVKDKKTNVLLNTQANQGQIVAQRRKVREQRNLEETVKQLVKRVEALEIKNSFVNASYHSGYPVPCACGYTNAVCINVCGGLGPNP